MDRPALRLDSGKLSVPEAPWAHLGVSPVRERLERAAASVGRLDVPDSLMRPYAGTAFVVGEGVVLTCRHVLRFLGLPSSRVFLDFGAPLHRRVPIDSVLLVHHHWDIALLRASMLEAEHPVLTMLHGPMQDDTELALIGFHNRDEDIAADELDQVLGGQAGIKRIAPGRSIGYVATKSFGHPVRALGHDCRGYDGSSGGPVVDVDTGGVVGVHFGTTHALELRHAVPACELARDPSVVAAGVRFDGVPTLPPAEWL